MNNHRLVGRRFQFMLMAFFGLGTLMHGNPSRGAPGKTKGFVVSRFVPAVYVGDSECPQGFAEGPDVASILAKLPAAERERLKRPESQGEYGALSMAIRHRGHGFDACLRPESYPDPGLRTVQGNIALGLNLDSSDGRRPAANTCPHENFVSPTGETGIDNQLYRILGCVKQQRPDGLLHGMFDAFMRQGNFTILIEIRGLDDAYQDKAVEVGFYSSSNPIATNTDGVVLTNASLSVHPDKHYQNVARGKIVDGVLTTEPTDIRFELTNEVATFRLPRDYVFRDARIRLELKADGTAHGVLAGYQDLGAAYSKVAAFGEDTAAGPLQCPGLYYALLRLADGYPDRNGACTWISSAYELSAVPAFVIHPRERSQVATEQR